MNKAELAARFRTADHHQRIRRDRMARSLCVVGHSQTLGAMIEQNGFASAITPYGLAQLRAAFIEADDARRIALGTAVRSHAGDRGGLAIMSAAVAELQIGQWSLPMRSATACCST
jgi:hypothetical protein